MLTFVDGDNENHYVLVNDLINQTIPRAAQLDFVAVWQRAQAIGLYARVEQNL